MAFRTEESHQSILREVPPASLKVQETDGFSNCKFTDLTTDLEPPSPAKEGCSGDFLVNFSSSLSITPKASTVHTATLPQTSTSPLRHRSAGGGALNDVQTLLQIESDHSFLAEESPFSLTTPVKTPQIKMPSEQPLTNNPSPLRSVESANGSLTSTPSRLKLPSQKYSAISDVTNFSARITKRFEEIDYSAHPSKIPRLSSSYSSPSPSKTVGKAMQFPMPFVKKKEKGATGFFNASTASKESSQMCINLSIPQEMLSSSYRPPVLSKFSASRNPPASPFSPYKKW